MSNYIWLLAILCFPLPFCVCNSHKILRDPIPQPSHKILRKLLRFAAYIHLGASSLHGCANNIVIKYLGGLQIFHSLDDYKASMHISGAYRQSVPSMFPSRVDEFRGVA